MSGLLPMDELRTVLREVLSEVLAARDASAPLTAEMLIKRWAVTGETQALQLYNLARQCRERGLSPLKGTRGMQALYGLVEVQAAESFARGVSKRRRRAR